MRLQCLDALLAGAFFMAIFSEAPAQVSLPVDFETAVTTVDFTDFDGGTAEVVSNPDVGEGNVSATVGSMVRNGGAVWAGSFLTLDAPLDFSEASSIRMKVWSPRQGVRMKLKLEGPTELFFEVDQWNVMQGGWEVVHWDFANAMSMTFDKLVFMFDFEATGDGSAESTFYFDDIEQVDASYGLAQMDLPCTFEDPAENPTTYDFWGAASNVVVDPTNPDNLVVEVVKMETASTWAGTMIGTVEGFANPIPFTDEEKIVSVRVWTPQAGTPILLKAEMVGGNPFYTETIQYTSEAGWETVEFNFGNELPNTPELEVGFPHHLLVIFFGYGEDAVPGGETFYFDDVYFGQAPVTGIDAPPAEDVVLYPNPLREGDVLRGTGFDAGTMACVVDAMGRIVWQGPLSSEGTELGLSRGAYVVNLNHNGATVRQRLVIR